MENITIDELYDHKRFKKSTISNYLLLVIYFPFGILCVIFRIIFLTFILLLSKLIKLKKRLINSLLIKAFGIKAYFYNISNFDFNGNSIIVANHIVLGDFLPFLLMKRKIIVVGSGTMNRFWKFLENLVRKIVIHDEGLRGLRKARIEIKNALENNEENVSLLMFPEGTIGSGKALHKFNRLAFTFNVEIQPVYIRLKHHFPISLHPINSSHTMNVLYSLFVPRLVYHITFIPKQKKKLNEKPKDFAVRVQLLMADSAKVIPSNFTITDKNNYKKQL
ncbi:MAG: 1-acyl-sn-glycerol-3-phosphate acyltransferase [Bacteroidota bacterium]